MKTYYQEEKEREGENIYLPTYTNEDILPRREKERERALNFLVNSTERDPQVGHSRGSDVDPNTKTVL